MFDTAFDVFKGIVKLFLLVLTFCFVADLILKVTAPEAWAAMTGTSTAGLIGGGLAMLLLAAVLLSRK